MNLRKAQKKDISEKWFPIFEKLFGYKNKIKMVNYDFNKSWYCLFYPYFVPLFITFSIEICAWIFFSNSPILISQIAKNQNLQSIYWFSFLFLVVYLSTYFSLYFYCRAVAGIKYSLMNGAYQYFLLVDPLSHTTRSSGQIISKIDRSTTAIENLIDIGVFDFIPVVIQILVIVYTMIGFNLQIGLISGFTLVSQVVVSVFVQFFIVKIAVPPDIKQEDIQKQLNVESLTQVAHIRSSFATTEQIMRLNRESKRTAEVQSTNWMTFISSQTLPRLFFIVSFGYILLSMFDLISKGVVDTLTGTALLVMYFSSYSYIANVGRRMERLVSNIDKIKDLFTFIRDFGVQTYPVLPQK